MESNLGRKRSFSEPRSYDMGVSENSGTPKSSILIGFSIINHPFWGTPIFGNTHMEESRVETPGRVSMEMSCNLP